MGQKIQKAYYNAYYNEKADSMRYDEILNKIKKMLIQEKNFELTKLLSIYREFVYNPIFPLSLLQEIYVKKKLDEKFDLFVPLKNEYIKISKKFCYKEPYTNLFESILNKEEPDYDVLIKTQKEYIKYKQLKSDYKKEIKL